MWREQEVTSHKVLVMIGKQVKAGTDIGEVNLKRKRKDGMVVEGLMKEDVLEMDEV